MSNERSHLVINKALLLSHIFLLSLFDNMTEDFDDFFNEDYELPASVMEDIRKIEKISKPIADENDYNAWGPDIVSQTKSTSIPNTSQGFQFDENDFKSNSKIALRSLKSDPNALAVKENYLLTTSRMLTTDMDLCGCSKLQGDRVF